VNHSRRPRDRGFTLVELMVVVLVIAILLAVAIPTFLGARSKSADAVATSNVTNAGKTVAAFLASTGALPTTSELTSLMSEFTVVSSPSTRPNQISIMATPQIVQLAAQSTSGYCPMAIVRANGVITTSTSTNCSASNVLWLGQTASSFFGSGGSSFTDEVIPVDSTKIMSYALMFVPAMTAVDKSTWVPSTTSDSSRSTPMANTFGWSTSNGHRAPSTRRWPSHCRSAKPP
jgi:type IV pilus assembly protein PilA